MEIKNNNEMEEILEQKEKILNHVLYEMQMYLYMMFVQNKDDDQLITNLIMVSHLIHMRNLLYFFSDDKSRSNSNIIYSDIIEGITLAVDKETKKDAKKIINKSIAHLTKERIESKGGFTEKTMQLIDEMKEILPKKICDFINALDICIKAEYKHELEKPDIVGALNYIRNMLDNRYTFILSHKTIET